MISKAAGTFMVCVCDVDQSETSVLLLSGPGVSQPHHWGGGTIHVKLIIISDFSRASSTSEGPPTSRSHLTAGGALLERASNFYLIHGCEICCSSASLPPSNTLFTDTHTLLKCLSFHSVLSEKVQ